MTNSPSRILLVKLGAVGDVIHTLYPLRALREAFPDARIAWAVEDKSAEILRDNPDLDEIIVFQRRGSGGGLLATGEFLRIARRLRAFRPDLTIDFQSLFKSGLLALLSGARRRIGFDKWREGNFLFTNDRAQSRKDENHAVQKNLALLRLLGIEAGGENDNDEKAPVRIHADPTQRRRVDAFFESALNDRRPVAAINPGASWPTKKWPTDRYGELAKRLAEEQNAAPLVIWGPGEKTLAEEVVSSSADTAVMAPETSLRELAHLLDRCDLYVGGDTGPMHVAAVMGTPSVALFAPSDPARVRPWNVPYRVVEPAGVECLHCWKRDRCERLCIREIGVDEVAEAAHSLLREVRCA